MTGILDPSLINSVKGFEGYSANPYWDYKQYTSGYGTKASPGESIDRATAEQRLVSELVKAASYVDGLNPEMPAGVRNALTSLTFNAGPKWINSGLGEAVRAGDWKAAQAKFLEYNKAGGQVNPGLVKRRQQEASWFDGSPEMKVTTQAPMALPAQQGAVQQSGKLSVNPMLALAAFGSLSPPPMTLKPPDPPPRRQIDLSRLRAALQQGPGLGPFSILGA